MPRDHLATIRALRAKAADPAVTPDEAKALTEKADELAEKYGNPSSPPTDDTTVTSRDGFWTPPSYMYDPDGTFNPFRRPPGFTDPQAASKAWETLRDLHKNQHKWNRPPDEADLVEEDYQSDPEDEDYGYDMHEGNDW